MDKREKVIKGLERCFSVGVVTCSECPYSEKPFRLCLNNLGEDVLELLEATKPEKLMSALYDVRDRWIARLPKSEWYRDKRAQGVGQGIEMCIKRMSEVLYGNE